MCLNIPRYNGVKSINTSRPPQNGRHFPDAIFKCIFLFENVWIWIKISLKYVPKVRINNIPSLVLVMAWRRIGDKPLSEPMMVTLLTHICVTRPQWVNASISGSPFNAYRDSHYIDKVVACIIRIPTLLAHQFTETEVILTIPAQPVVTNSSKWYFRFRVNVSYY